MAQLVADDVLLLKVLQSDCRFLTRKQIRPIYGHRRRANKRLSALLKGGYLECRHLFSSYQAFKSPLYFLGKRGAALAGLDTRVYGELRERACHTAERAIPHLLRVYDVYLKFLLTKVLGRWVWFKEPGLTAIDMGVVPDAFVQYVRSGEKYEAFIEVDRGTESNPKLEERLGKYHHFHRSGRFRDLYSGCGFRVLIFVEDVRGVQLPSEDFWMAKTADFMEKPIDARLFRSSSKMHSLFERQAKETLPSGQELAERALAQKRLEQEEMLRKVREDQLRAGRQRALDAARERRRQIFAITRTLATWLVIAVGVCIIWLELRYLYGWLVENRDELVAEAKQLVSLGGLLLVAYVLLK